MNSPLLFSVSKKYGPWEITESKVVYENPWIKVIEDKVIRPDKKPGIYGTIKIQPGISVLAFHDERNLYFVQEFKYGTGKTSIEVVGGGVDSKESPLETAKRELKEELGITAEKWIDCGEYTPMSTFLTSPQRLFLATNLHFSENNPEGVEVLKTVKLSLNDALKKIENCEITEGKTRILILEAYRYFQLKNQKV